MTQPNSTTHPPPEANVAQAYPRSKSPLTRLVLFIALVASILAYYLRSNSIRSLPFPFRNNKSSTSPRLAVCYTGHIATHAHVYEQNLEAIHAVDPHAAFFYYVDLQDDYHHEHTGTRYQLQHEIGSLQPIFDQVHAQAVSTFTPSEVGTPEQGHCYHRPDQSQHHYTNYFMQFYAANKCYQMVRQAEQSGQTFDWILRLQPNMNIALHIPNTTVQPRVHMSGAAIALVPRQMADAFFSVVQAFEDDKCRVMDHMGREPCINYSYDADSVECLIIKWLKESDIVPSNGVYVNRRIIYPTDGL